MPHNRLYALIDTSNHTVRMVENPNWDGDWPKRYGITERKTMPGSNALAIRIDGYAECIPYNEELVNSNGCSYRLICYTEEHKGNVLKAKKYLRNKFDVVRMIVSFYEIVDITEQVSTNNPAKNC